MSLARLRASLADRYRIERELGQGGMATVYLAEDLRHARQVAIKVLHEDLGAALGAERFLAEIKTTARLQHPHILPLLDSGSVQGLEGAAPLLYYVMPYVSGESLRDRLIREKQLPIDDAFRLAREVADALGHAHALGVIHRDIKPENILLQGGHAQVADFGIALAVQSAGGQRLTQTGLSLGTPQYMSPEQAMGERTIDARSDLYALGAVTYEMLVGEPPFTGPTVQAVVARLLTEEPRRIVIQRKAVPGHVETAVLRALAKLPADRHGSAREFADALAGGGTAPPPTVAGGAPATTRERRVAQPWKAASAVLAVATLTTSWLALRAGRAPDHETDTRPVIRTRLDLPAGARIADALAGTTIAVSPAGDMIAFTSISVQGIRMYLRRVDELGARQIASENNAGRNMVFSPDGRWLAFTEGNLVRKVAVDGGNPITIGLSGGAVPYGLSWSAGDTIYVGSYSGLWWLPAAGGDALQVQVQDTTAIRVGRRWPLLLPGDRALVYARGNSTSAASQLSALDLTTRVVVDYTLQVSVPLGVQDGHLVYVAANGDLMAVPIDEASGRPLGDPVQLESGVLVDLTAGTKASLSRSGTLVMIRGRAELQPVLVEPGGASVPLLPELRNYATPRFSPDGRRVAVTVFSASSTDLWIYDLGRNTFSRLTTDGTSIRPEWTPDGREVLFISDRGGRSAVWRHPADGGGQAVPVYRPAFEPFEAVPSPDGRTLVVRSGPGQEYPRDILALPYPVPVTEGNGPLTPLVTGPGTESLPRFSPDGRWLAYQSNTSGRFEIFVRPFPGAAGPVQVSTEGGTEPIWGRDGRTLYYRGPVDEVIKVSVRTGAEFAIGARQTVHRGEYLNDASHANWDVAPDGRLLLLRRAGAESEVVVVHGWNRELRARVRGRR